MNVKGRFTIVCANWTEEEPALKSVYVYMLYLCYPILLTHIYACVCAHVLLSCYALDPLLVKVLFSLSSKCHFFKGFGNPLWPEPFSQVPPLLPFITTGKNAVRYKLWFAWLIHVIFGVSAKLFSYRLLADATLSLTGCGIRQQNREKRSLMIVYICEDCD